MKIGIIGPEASGKTTLFEALSGVDQKYDFSEKQMIHNIKVPDERIDILSDLYMPKKTTYTNIDIVDFQGLSIKENKTFGLDQQYINRLKELDGYLIVLDNFSSIKDYNQDIENIINEIILNDMLLIETRLQALKKANNIEGEYPVLERLYNNLSNNITIRDLNLSEREKDIISHYRFLSQKPYIIIVNSSEERIIKKEDGKIVFMNIQMEKEICELSKEDQMHFLKDLGYKKPLIDRIIQRIYNMMNLISFLTIGKNEIRAWTIRKGSDAHKAASKIHSDIARGFIRAEVIHYNDFMDFKSVPNAKKAGRIRSEGKNYIVQDGDIIEFRFNVR